MKKIDFLKRVNEKLLECSGQDVSVYEGPLNLIKSKLKDVISKVPGLKFEQIHGKVVVNVGEYLGDKEGKEIEIPIYRFSFTFKKDEKGRSTDIIEKASLIDIRGSEYPKTMSMEEILGIIIQEEIGNRKEHCALNMIELEKKEDQMKTQMKTYGALLRKLKRKEIYKN